MHHRPVPPKMFVPSLEWQHIARSLFRTLVISHSLFVTLRKKNTQFTWTTEHNLAFTRVKDALTSDTVMAYFDNQKTTELVTDASPWGFSAIISQCTPGKDDPRIVAYVSRSLSPVETRYSQTEREALAIVWAIERLHIYLYGAKFNLYTDCKPMEIILGNRTSRT